MKRKPKCGNCGRRTNNIYYTNPKSGIDTRHYKDKRIRCKECFESEYRRVRRESQEEW
jgi:hypothetical protein